jgi:hypothetical protein
MQRQDVSQCDEPVTNEAVLMGLAWTFLHPLAPLLLSPYITEACLVPFLESLCNLSSVSGHFKNKTPSGKKRRLMLFLDMMWAFLEVRYFICIVIEAPVVTCSLSRQVGIAVNLLSYMWMVPGLNSNQATFQIAI